MLRRFTQDRRRHGGLPGAHAREPEPLARRRVLGQVLLELARRGVSRERAYELVQRNAMRAVPRAGAISRACCSPTPTSRPCSPRPISPRRSTSASSSATSAPSLIACSPRRPCRPPSSSPVWNQRRCHRPKSPGLRDPQTIGVRSTGPRDRRIAARDGLPGGRRRAARQVLRDRRRGGFGGRRARDGQRGPDRLLANPVIESYQGGRSHEVCDRRFSRIQLRSRRVSRDDRVIGQQAELVWHKETDLRGADAVDPARRLLPRRLPAHRRHRALLADHDERRSVRRGGRSGGRHLQRLPDPARGRAAARRDDAQPRRAVRCEHVHVRVEQTDTPFTTACHAGPGAADPDRARRGQLLRRSRGRSIALEAERPGGLPLRHGRRRDDRRREPERLAGQHRRHLQRARAMSSA